MALRPPLRPALAAAVLLVPLLARADAYTLVDLGDCQCHPVAISPGGGIVVANRIAAPFRGEEWRGGKWHHFHTHSTLTSINKSGDVGGYFQDGAHAGKGAVWPRRGGPALIDAPAGGTNAQVNSLTADHFGEGAEPLVTGSYVLGSHQRCFVQVPGYAASDLGLPAGATDCVARNVNAYYVVGTAVLANGHEQAWSRYFGSNFAALELLPGDDYSEAWSQDRTSTVVGTSGKVGAGAHAVWWIDPQLAIDLDKPDTYYKSVALSISPDKSAHIVGYASTCAGCASTAVRFDLTVYGQEHAVPLISEVTNPGNWISLSVATAVDAKGVIVGWGDNGVNPDEPFMLVPQARQR